jgi:hypothetical protein
MMVKADGLGDIARKPGIVRWMRGTYPLSAPEKREGYERLVLK